MSREALEGLIDRWTNDAGFRQAMRKDPEATVRGTGVKLSSEEHAAFANIDWSLSDEELQTRMSKAGA